MFALTRSPRDGPDPVVATYDDISIQFTIVYVDGSQVRDAIDGPQAVTLMREELLDDVRVR